MTWRHTPKEDVACQSGRGVAAKALSWLRFSEGYASTYDSDSPDFTLMQRVQLNHLMTTTGPAQTDRMIDKTCNDSSMIPADFGDQGPAASVQYYRTEEFTFQT